MALSGMSDHSRLKVWQRAHRFAVDIHGVAASVDPRQAPGLRAQLLRAAGSIAANIAEGAGQEHVAQFARFLSIAIASSHEVENHMVLAVDLGMMSEEGARLLREVSEIRRMLYGLRKSLRRRQAAG
jgi:four helix bundle protein